MTFIVGLTGGIGSGKSAAAACFRELGVLVVNADDVARDVVEPGTDALRQIADRYGDEILLFDKTLDRAALRKIIFEDPGERAWLESLTHPLIRQSIHAQLTAKRHASEANYRILESPLLIETSQRELVKRICVVDVSLEEQIRRVMARDHNNEAQVRAIIEAQAPRQQRLGMADDIIDNNGGLDTLRARVINLHDTYQALANECTAKKST